MDGANNLTKCYKKEYGIAEDFYNKVIKFSDDINDAISIIKDKDILNKSKGKEIIVAFGNTGAGKSTTLNLLCENILVIEEGGYTLSENNINSFKIGQGSESETLLPGCLEIDELLIFDLPGLNYIRGSEIAFLNVSCIREILTKAKSVRFLFVEGKCSLEVGRAKSFKDFLNVISNLFCDDSILKGSSIWVVTQSHTQDQNKLISWMKQKLEPEFITTLSKIFSLEKPFSIVPFLHYHNLNEKSEKKREQSYNNTRSMMKDMLKTLEKKKINKINESVLLNPDTWNLIKGSMVVIATDILSTYPFDEMSMEELTELHNKPSTLENAIQKKIESQPESSFIRALNNNFYDEKLSGIIKEKVNEIREKIENIKLKKEKEEGEKIIKEANEKLLKAEQENKKYDEDILKIKEDMKTANEENRKKLEEMKILSEKEREKNDIIQKQLENSRKLEIDNINKVLERETQLKKEAESLKLMRKAYTESSEYHNLCKTIDSLFANLGQKRKHLAEELEYKKTRSSVGTILKGLFSLGVHTFCHNNKEKELELECKDLEKELKETLNRYQIRMGGEAHSRHYENY